MQRALFTPHVAASGGRTIGGQGIAESGIHRMAEVMPTNCLCDAS